uniref:Uncharacterized protein n=1 Tax=Phytophthora ramorum TaxID=164328 RepID=H3H9D9_PHYRM
MADSTATITMYSDLECNIVATDTSLDSQTLSSSPRRYAVGGLGGPSAQGRKTAVVVYDNSSCSAPAVSVTLTSSLTCTPQANHYDPICVEDGAAYSVSDCTNYNRGGWDDVGLVREAFNGYSYLGVETYVSGRCGQYDSIARATLYRLDENCYANAAGTTSHKLTLSHSAIITTYSDATCTNVATTTTVRQSSIGANRYGFCVDEMTVFIGGVQPNFTAVASYDDDTCSTTPTQIRFSQDFKCLGTTDAPCQADDDSHFSASGCAGDFFDYSATAFGMNSPYVIVEDFRNPWCNDVELVTKSDGAVVITTYPTSSCQYQDAFVFVLDSWNVNTGTCVDNKIFRTSKMPLATEINTPPTTTPAPQTWTPTPTPTAGPPPITVPVEDETEARLKIMFPDWLWESPPPRIFASDGRHYHQRSPDHRFP